MKTEIRKEGVHEMSDKNHNRFTLMAYDIDNDMYGELYHSDSFDEIERAAKELIRLVEKDLLLVVNCSKLQSRMKIACWRGMSGSGCRL